MENKLHISVSPHIHSKRSTQKIMLDVLIALLPATIAGVVIFGITSLAVIAVCVGVAVLSEFLFNLIVKKQQTISDLSAVVTGLLLALNLPANVPLWQAAIGTLFAIIIVKCLFGGIGRNVVNPAITARVFMLVAFSSLTQAAFPVDSTAGATPLPEIVGGLQSAAETGTSFDVLTVVSLKDLFLGNVGGAIGETCSVALLIGGIYLLVRKVITWHIPVAFIGTAFVFSLALHGFDPIAALSLVLSGGLILGAIFMATDYVTSPTTPLGKLIFGIGAGLITVLIREWGIYPEGVSFAILIMNILNPYIDSLTARKMFGGAKK
ncbi:MAG: RnfABCDGE type electron transport complex subunit D [Ruminococcaceae bacterium]|nr:RnfABCDGE type electron transport complex subunit D [Oscillospiraceae bacterium]